MTLRTPPNSPMRVGESLGKMLIKSGFWHGGQSGPPQGLASSGLQRRREPEVGPYPNHILEIQAKGLVDGGCAGALDRRPAPAADQDRRQVSDDAVDQPRREERPGQCRPTFEPDR